MKSEQSSLTVALVGCPNVGKSTVFNALTGMKQKTGNWAGVTVSHTAGDLIAGDTHVTLIDLPGTYSLTATSPEEEVTSAYLRENKADCVLCVVDACSPERGLALALEVREIAENVMIVLNLIDEAEKRGIRIDASRLSALTGLRVIETAAREKRGIPQLKCALAELTHPCADCAGCASCSSFGGSTSHAGCTARENRQSDAVCSSDHATRAAHIVAECTSYTEDPTLRDRAIDRVVCGKITAPIIMLALLSLVLWLTLMGSGYISDALSYSLGYLHGVISAGAHAVLPTWLASVIVDGAVATAFRVIAVMLPPMAIFFPLFTVLEDLGYLPRVAFCLDRGFACCGACGKQSLTMMMGLGCNAAGVTGCRIIESRRERDIAIITNSLIPCNGRFPLIIVCLSCLGLSGIASAAALTALCIAAVLVTLGVSKLLSVTLHGGEKSFFTLELPPYRPPELRRVIVRSLLDKCTLILARAVTVSLPAGVVIWLLSNVTLGGSSLYSHLAAFLEPIGALAGMDGVLMLSFILALPAAELMLPLALSGGAGGIALFGEMADIPSAFASMGWGGTTVLCTMIFMMFHFPCATTLATVYRETGSVRTTALSAVIPTVIGYTLCVAVNLISHIL